MTEAATQAVAEAVVELLIERGLVVAAVSVHDGRVLSAAQAARVLGRRRQWVYAHAEELGAFRYGDGPRARLGFDRAELERWKRGQQIRRASTEVRASRRAAAGRTSPTGANLIPFEPMSQRRSIDAPDPR